jgi:nucleotide-binding universal stress UspA family protein
VRTKILLALFDEHNLRDSLNRALSLSRILDAELFVLRVLPEATRLNPLFPHVHVAHAVQSVEATLRTVRNTRSWLEDLFLDEVRDENISVRTGPFVEQVAEHAAHVGAELIVMPPHRGPFGNIVTTLALTAGLPVLVARGATSSDAIVAATDLEDTDYPVLRQAARLGHELDAPVIAVHNVRPVSLLLQAGLAWPHTMLASGSATEARRRQLLNASRRLDLHSENVVAQQLDHAEAILHEARTRDADIVVVGSHDRGWLDRVLSASVAVAVVNRARRSVLVTPVGSSRSAHAANQVQ